MTAAAPTPIVAPEAERRWLLVSAAGASHALALDSVRELVPARPCTRIPGAPACVLGLLNLRGRVLTVVDLGACPGGTAAPRTGQKIVVLHHDGREVGLLVDEALRIVSLTDAGAGPCEVVDSGILLGPIFG